MYKSFKVLSVIYKWKEKNETRISIQKKKNERKEEGKKKEEEEQ